MAVTTDRDVRARRNRTGYRARPAPAGGARGEEEVPGQEELDGMEGFFKILGDATRLRILHALLPGGAVRP